MLSANPGMMDHGNYTTANNIFTNSQHQQNAAMLNQVPRAVHGQGGMPQGMPQQSRPLMSGMNSPMQMPNQGRPIVKVGMGQSVNAGADLGRGGMPTSKATVTHNKQFLASNNQGNGVLLKVVNWGLEQMAFVFEELTNKNPTPSCNHSL